MRTNLSESEIKVLQATMLEAARGIERIISEGNKVNLEAEAGEENNPYSYAGFAVGASLAIQQMLSDTLEYILDVQVSK